MSPDIDRVVADVAKSLNKARVPYMIIGGIANAVWGEPRVTTDIDITVAAPAPYALKLLKALGAKVARAPEDPVDFAAYGVLPIIHKSGVRVEFAFGMVSYVHQAMDRVVEINLYGVPVRFCSAEDLVLHKIISERQKDRDDVVGIFRHRRATLDRAYLDPRVHELAVVMERPEIEQRYRRLFEEE